MASEAHLLTLTSRLEEMHSQLGTVVEEVESDGREDLTGELLEIERAVGVAARRLLKVARALRT